METNRELDAIKDRRYTLESAESDLMHAVVCAALAGRSWAQIGEALNVSKQTAFNRYRKDVQFYEDLENRKTKLEETTRDRMLNRLFNPEPVLEYNRDYSMGWTRTETTPAADAENVNGHYECQCGWNIVYPLHDPEEVSGAMDDIAEHVQMHQDEDDRAATVQTPAGKVELGPEDFGDALPHLGPSEVTTKIVNRCKELGLPFEVELIADTDQLQVIISDPGPSRGWLQVLQSENAVTGKHRHAFYRAGEQAGKSKLISYAAVIATMKEYAAGAVWTGTSL